MELKNIDGTLLHHAIIMACESVVRHRESLNAINVFPVADGDTGDNMASTAMSIIQNSQVKPSLRDTLISVANAALTGARGNSGMIFSQFFNGLTEEDQIPDTIDTNLFARLLVMACQSVRKAILHPVEGTIITVMDAWAKAVSDQVPDVLDFNTLLSQSIPAVEKALQSTALTLPVLQEAHVVDAGALGFSEFIKGFSAYLAAPHPIDISAIHLPEVDTHHELPSGDKAPEERYCTEILLTGEALNREQLTMNLEAFGDCIVSSGNSSLSRFHLHCNEPWHVFDLMRKQGTISQAKAQDMLRQYQMAHQNPFPIALVVDSSADLPKALMDKYQVHVISLNMHLDAHHLLDRICINPDTFYDELATLKTYPKTSCPATGIIEEQIRHISAYYQHVLVLPIAKALSATHDAIINASRAFANVHVLDTKSTSAGIGLLLDYAGQMMTEGLDIETIKTRLMAVIPKTKFLVYVHQFDSLIRSGRVNKIRATIAQWAHIKPIITLDESGKGVVCDKAFSETKALTKIIQAMQKWQQTHGLKTYAIVHAGAPDKATAFAQWCSEAFQIPPAFVEPVSSAIGLHAGQGCIGLVGMGE